MNHVEDLFHFVGVRPPVKRAKEVISPQALLESPPGNLPGLTLEKDEGASTYQDLLAATRDLIANPDVRLLTAPEQAETHGLQAASKLNGDVLTVAEALALLAASPLTDPNTMQSSDALNRDKYRAAATVMAVHFDLRDVDPDFATWTLGFGSVLDSVMSGPGPLELTLIEAVKRPILVLPKRAAQPGLALARTPAVGELLLVRQRLTGYHLGEIAEIENVMATETRSHWVRRQEDTEHASESEIEREVSTEQETTLNQRNELQSEINKALAEQWSVHGDLRYETKLGPTTKLNVDVGGSYSSSTSEATRSAATFAKDTTERSVKRVREKSVERRRSLSRVSLVDEQRRGFVNDDATPKVGIYRWVESDWEATLHNYGQRLLLEFIVPEPGIWLSEARRARIEAELDLPEPHPPMIRETDAAGNVLTDAAGRPRMRPLLLSDLEPSNYSSYIAAYMVQGAEPPPFETAVAATVQVGEGAKDRPEQFASAAVATLKVPDGYEALSGRISVLTSLRKEDNPEQQTITLSVAGRLLSSFHQDNLDIEFTIDPTLTGTVPVAIWTDYTRGLVGTVRVSCRPTAQTMVAWRQRTFELISGAYAEARQVYEARLASARAKRQGDVAGTTLNVTKSHILAELKKHVVGLLNPARVATGSRPLGVDAIATAVKTADVPVWLDVVDKNARDALSFVEQAIEWSTLQYVTYPYFWTAEDRWKERFSDSFERDILGEFLSAGAARVVAAVPMEFEHHMLYYLDTGKPWLGGTAPTPGSEGYVSIAEELKERTNDQPLSPKLESWTYSLPTNQVMLQADAVLPSFPSDDA